MVRGPEQADIFHTWAVGRVVEDIILVSSLVKIFGLFGLFGFGGLL